MEAKKIELTLDEFKTIVEFIIQMLQRNEDGPELFEDMQDSINEVSDIIIKYLTKINERLVEAIKEKEMALREIGINQIKNIDRIV
jgi:MinD-like ATPase involved in chromosome partitioning or flagellar assembly